MKDLRSRFKTPIALVLIATMWVAGDSSARAAVRPPTHAPPTPAPCGTKHTNLLAALDRPTIGYATCAVRPGDIVGEFGYDNTISTGSRYAFATYPQGFIRYGVARRFEVDFIGPAYGVRHLANGSIQRGFFDSGLGFKLQSRPVGRALFAIDGLLTFPTGASAFTIGAPTETVNLDASYALSNTTGIAETLGFTSASGTRLSSTHVDASVARYTAFLPSAVITQLLGARTQLYLEAYGATRVRPNGGSRFAMDGGVQYMLTPQLEVDAELGRTVTELGPSHYLGFGFGIRV
ncbi:MAG: transporter [Vulcanimicrobiaceae bacterium]